MKHYQWTLFGIGIAISLLVLVIVFDLDIFEFFLTFLHSLERFEVDEFILPLLIILICLAIDFFKIQRRRVIEYEKVRIYKAMLASAHHVLNNFLNQIQLFKITAESTPNFDTEVLEIFDSVIDEAANQIKALGSINSVDETTIRKSVAPK
jgi:hypothetical protein